jgi:hypothetical protein
LLLINIGCNLRQVGLSIVNEHVTWTPHTIATQSYLEILKHLICFQIHLITIRLTKHNVKNTHETAYELVFAMDELCVIVVTYVVVCCHCSF